MKKLQRRAYSALLVALCLLVGMGVYVGRFAAHGRDWANFTGNAAVYENGKVLTGKITDRNGLVLDIAQVLNALTAKVQSLNARSLPEGNAMVHITMEVPDLASLQLIIARIRTLGGVRQIERGNG